MKMRILDQVLDVAAIAKRIKIRTTRKIWSKGRAQRCNKTYDALDSQVEVTMDRGPDYESPTRALENSTFDLRS